MNDSKVWFWNLLNVLLVVLVSVGLGGVKAFWRYSNSLPSARTITVSAEGKTTAVPDIAAVSFSVVTEGKNPESVVAENTKKMNVSIEAVKKEGLDSKDIKTAGYNLSPRYEYDEDRKTNFISGYTLTQTVTLKIRDFSKIGKILGLLPGLGVNQVGGLSFDVDDPEGYLNTARQEAFEKAFAKAKAMAEQNRTKIKRVVTFSDSPSYYPRPLYFASESAFGKGGAAPTPIIEPGSQEVTVSVSVTYEIR